MIDEYGFTAIKLKGGVFPPDEEIAAIKALRAEFPDLPLRLDPNAAWSVDTSIRVAAELDGIVEYLEDPTAGLDGMAEVAAEAKMPLATNMCVVAFDHLDPAVRKNSVSVVLSDHHYWGGLQRSRLLAGICDTFGLGLSMHSNSHLGISLMAMTHVAAAVPNLAYACDTHYPWQEEDEEVIRGGKLPIRNGCVAITDAPGLGVELDQDQLAKLHEQFLAIDIRSRDDVRQMRKYQPDWETRKPRF